MIKMQTNNITLNCKCNNDCFFCSCHTEEKNFGEVMLEISHLKKKGHKSVIFSGGEPLIRKDIINLIMYAKKSGMDKIHIVTNGRMLHYNGFVKKIIEAGANSFSILLIHTDPNTNDNITKCPKSLQQTLDGILNLKKFKVPIQINIPIIKQNSQNLIKLLELAKSLGVDSLIFSLIYTKDNMNMPYISDLNRTLSRVLDLGKRNNISVSIKDLPLCNSGGIYRYNAEEVGLCFTQSANKSKAEQCRFCKFEDKCNGIFSDYLKERSGFELTPITEKTKQKVVKEEIKIRTLEVVITEKCNLNCRMCFLRNKQRIDTIVHKKDLLELFKSTMRYGIKRVVFVGGEVFSHKDIFDYIRYVSDLNLESCIFTNAQFFNKNLVNKILESGLSEIFFSLDSITQSIFDKIRLKEGAFNKTIEAIKLTKKMRDEAKSNLKININTVIMGINVHEIFELMKFVYSLGVDGINYNPVYIHRSNIQKKNVYSTINKIEDLNKLWIFPDKYKILDSNIDKLIKFKRENGFILLTEHHLNLLKKYFRSPFIKSLGLSCDMYKHVCILDTLGNIKPCGAGVTDTLQYPFKKNKDFEEVISSKIYLDLCKVVKNCNTPCCFLLLPEYKELGCIRR